MPPQVFPGAGGVAGRLVPSGLPFYTTGEDNLRLLSFNVAAGVKLKLNARTLTPRGEVIADSWDHTPRTDRTVASSDYTLSGTTVLNLMVLAASGAPRVGQTFVILQLIRGVGASALVLGTLLQGYVTGSQALAWPGSPIQASVDSGGYARGVIGTTPAAGAVVIETCPTGARWQLVSVQVQFVTDATAGTRYLSLQWSIGGLQVGNSPGVQGLGPSQNATYGWDQAMPLTQALPIGQNVSGLPIDTILLGGDFFAVEVVGIAAGDQFSNVRYAVREWLEAA